MEGATIFFRVESIRRVRSNCIGLFTLIPWGFSSENESDLNPKKDDVLNIFIGVVPKKSVSIDLGATQLSYKGQAYRPVDPKPYMGFNPILKFTAPSKLDLRADTNTYWYMISYFAEGLNAAKNFSLSIPSITIDGRTVDVPTVNFEPVRRNSTSSQYIDAVRC